jgi:hypothetical protein
MPETDLTYSVYFNSGLNNRTNLYTEGANITNIVINNTDQSYYQNGYIELYDCSAQIVGDTISVYFNGSLEFSGYISRRQIHHKTGKTYYTYQLLGRTYDLWRYRTDTDTSYEGYTSYIASSLVRDFCQGIVLPNSNPTEGYEFVNKVDFSNMKVGDAIVKLVGYDGYKFYVDNSGKLVYYSPSDEDYSTIIVNEDGVNGSEIIDMSPVEECDEDLFNDVKVIGGSGYSERTEVSLPVGRSIASLSSNIFKAKKMYAQRFKAKDDTLSAIRLFLNRTVDPYSPDNYLEVEIWDNSTKQLFEDDFTSMTNWSVTSNTVFIDGYLQLAGSEGVSTIEQDNWNASSPHMYHAQTFTLTETSRINTAIIESEHETGSTKTMVIQIRNTTGVDNHPGNTIYCSGSFSATTATYYSTPIQMNPKYVFAPGIYAVVVYIVPSSNNLYSRYYRVTTDADDPYTGGSKFYYDPSPGWVNSDGGATYKKYDYDFKCIFGGYPASGYALSKPFGRNIQGVKRFCQYMKADISGTISSSRIKISGSNSGSKNWRTLSDEQWYNFGFENVFSSQVKIVLSSNSSYTPKLKHVEVTISDAYSGPETTIYTDSFNDYTYLSGATRDKMNIDTQIGDSPYCWTYSKGYLMMSSNTDPGPYDYYAYPMNMDASVATVDNKGRWNNVSNITDSNSSSYAQANSQGTYNYGLVLTFSRYFDLGGNMATKTYSSHTVDWIYITSVYVSGNWAGRGFIKTWEGTEKIHPNDYDGGGVGYVEVTRNYFNSCTYYKVKKLLISGQYYRCTLGGDDLRFNSIRIWPTNLVERSGCIQTKDYNTGVPIKYLNISPTVVRDPNRISYSGSKTSGARWYSIAPNTWTQLGGGGASGSHIKVMYCMKPSTAIFTNANKHISTSRIKGRSPILSECNIKYSILAGGGLPRSGSKIEHSDDIYFESTDISYPPSYTAFNSYDYPKLKAGGGQDFNIDDYYWLVLYYPSSANEYFSYYYDPNTTYTDGLIAWSWSEKGLGYRWSSSDNCPTQIPRGSMIFDIGWREEDVIAVATNTDSINKYGIHQKIINDDTITSYEDAITRAQEEVTGMEEIPKKGSITIEGYPGLKVSYKISSNLTSLGLGGTWDIVGYTHTLDNRGFLTTINYGKQPFDISKRITDLEREVY